MITMKVLKPHREEFIVTQLAHIVGDGTWSKRTATESYTLDPVGNNWWARFEDGALSITGRYADAETMLAVKRLAQYRCGTALENASMETSNKRESDR